MDLKGLFKEKPLGLKIIIVIYSVAFLLYLLIGIIAFTSKGIIKKIPNFSISSLPETQAFSIIGAIFVILAILVVLTVVGLLKSKNWARILLIIFCVLNVLGGIISVFEGNFLSLINLLFNAGVSSYLILAKGAKKTFGPLLKNS